MAVDLDLLHEHGERTDPQSALAITGAVHHESFTALTVGSGAEHLVVISLVMAIQAGRWLGG